MKKNQLAENLNCWSAALWGLACAFRYPDEEWVTLLLSGEWLEALAKAIEPWGLFPEGLKKAVKELPSEPGKALETLQVEYTYLFINAVPRVPAPPYASAYTGQGLLMGEAAEEALRAYREVGLSLADDYHDLPDHLATELEFLAWLGGQAGAAYKNGEESEGNRWMVKGKAFLSQQLLPWLSPFRRRVEEASRISFYQELARLAEALLVRMSKTVET